MTESILIISDLHLSDQHPEIFDLFENFVKNVAPHASAFYILGDFFEVWVGDDDRSALPKKVSRLLFNLSQKGVKIYFMQGNRDFLLNRSYCHRSGVTFIEDPYVVDLLGHKVILSHGDLLCTDDVKYQQFRRIVRKRSLQRLFLSLPIGWRRKIAQHLRARSKKSLQKRGAWCEANLEVVRTLMQEYAVSYLIHGHTHEFKIYSEVLGTRYVLGDWDGRSGSYIKITRDDIQLKPFLPL